MKNKIFLKRKQNATEFKSQAKGIYPNDVIVCKVVTNDTITEQLELNFQLYAHNPLEEVPISFNLHFSKEHIPADLPNGELGYPSYGHILKYFVDVDENGVYVTHQEGIYWLLNQTRGTLPNGLGEINLSNWEFMANSEINALQWG